MIVKSEERNWISEIVLGGAPGWSPARVPSPRRLRLECVEEIHRALRMCGSGKDRPLVSFQHVQPVPDIRSVILTLLGCDAERSAEERGSKLGDQFFGCISVIAEAFT